MRDWVFVNVFCLILLFSSVVCAVENSSSLQPLFMSAILSAGGIPGSGGGRPIETPTGKVWVDRNIGAKEVATDLDDQDAWGDLFQWGRLADGHEERTSTTTPIQSTGDVPGNDKFIVTTQLHGDWRKTVNNKLWQGVSGTNNPCPEGYRLPTATELNAERATWPSQNSAGAVKSALKLTRGGYRINNNNTIIGRFYEGNYWSSTVNAEGKSAYLYFNTTEAGIDYYGRANAFSVRCLKD